MTCLITFPLDTRSLVWTNSSFQSTASDFFTRPSGMLPSVVDLLFYKTATIAFMMALDVESIQCIRDHLGEWLAEGGRGEIPVR